MTQNSIPEVYLISSREQLELLASSVRQEILDSLAVMGPSTMYELAESLGTPVDGLYYHVRLLKQSGLIVEEGTRATTRREAVVFRLPAKQLRLDYEVGEEIRGAIADVLAAALKTAKRDFKAGLQSESIVTSGTMRNLSGGRKKGWLSPTALKRVNELLDEVFELFQSTKNDEAEALFSFTMAFTHLDAMPPRRSADPPGQRG